MPQSTRLWVRIGIAITLLLVVIAGFSFVQNLSFRVAKIDPNPKEVSMYAPYIRVYFNREIDADSLKVSDYGGLFNGEWSVDDKAVTFPFKITLQEGKQYAFIINSVKSADGSELTDIKIEFTAKNISVDKLSEEQQKTLINKQDQYPYSVQYIAYPGFGELTDQGLSYGQLQSIKKAIFDYSQSVSEEFWTVKLDTNTVNIVFHDPSARDEDGSSATFTVNLDGQNYTVRAEYVDLDDAVYTRIYNAAGVQVFDSSAAQ